jgi:chromosome partitioning protein
LGRVVCIANQKGGVGKTTTAINLSASLAISGRRALLIDLDPQANATSGLGVRDIENRASTYDLLMGESSVEDVVASTSQEGLDILPAQRDLVGAEVELVQTLAREHRLTEAIAPIRERYDIILIDCPPSLGLLTINGLTAANSVLIPLQCEYYALEGLSALMDTVRLIRERLNSALEIEGILLTMFDTRNSLSHQVAEEVRQHFGDDVFQTMIPRNVRLSESPSHGVPVAQYDATSRGAQAYLDLAEELMPRGQGSPHAAPPEEQPRALQSPPVDAPAQDDAAVPQVPADDGYATDSAPPKDIQTAAPDSAQDLQTAEPTPVHDHQQETTPDERSETSDREVVDDGRATQSSGEGPGGPHHPGAGSGQGVDGAPDSDDSSDRDDSSEQISTKRDI